MRWITRENVKVDRVACPGLIKRFVDRRLNPTHRMTPSTLFVAVGNRMSEYSNAIHEIEQARAT